MSQILDKFIKSTILYEFHVPNIHKTIDYIETASYDCAIVEITSPGLVNRYVKDKKSHRKFTRCDLMLDSTNWYANIIFKLPTEINCDSIDDYHMKHSRDILQQELSWSLHLRSQTCVLMTLPDNEISNLSRELLLTTIDRNGTIIIELPIVGREAFTIANKHSDEKINITTAITAIWKRWNTFNMSVGFHKNFKLALELTSQMPNNCQLKRWFSEPVEYLILSSDLFTDPGKGIGILPEIKAICLEFIKRNPIRIIFKCRSGHFSDATNHLNAFKMIFAREVQSFHECTTNIPVAQIPDTIDHLIDISKCSLFVKMLLQKYKEAIHLAAVDRLKEKGIENVNLMFCGAHVIELLRCISVERTNIFIFEENVNVRKGMIESIPYLNANIRIISNENVIELHGKMDIIVAFSPELIYQGILLKLNYDRVAKYAALDTILIPRQSKVFIRPVMSPKVLAEIQNETYSFHQYQSPNRARDGGIRKQAIWITSIRHVCECSDEKELINFDYYSMEMSSIENRYEKLNFIIEQDCIVTGFAGYYEANLYKEINVSGHGVNDGSRNCYPIMYMPLVRPQIFCGGELLQTNFWLVHNALKGIFWYQWCTESPHITHIHNVKGVSSQLNYQ